MLTLSTSDLKSCGESSLRKMIGRKGEEAVIITQQAIVDFVCRRSFDKLPQVAVNHLDDHRRIPHVIVKVDRSAPRDNRIAFVVEK